MADTFNLSDKLMYMYEYNYDTLKQTVLTVSVDENFRPMGSLINGVLEDSLHSNIHLLIQCSACCM